MSQVEDKYDLYTELGAWRKAFEAAKQVNIKPLYVN